MVDGSRMIFLGFGKYARADKIYALEPLRGDERARGPADAGVGRGRSRADRRVAHGADDPLGDGPGGRRERRDRRRRGRARAQGPRRRRAGPARPRRPPAPRAAVARGDDEPGRLDSSSERHPLLPEELPPGLESPGVGERFAQLAIDLAPLRESPTFRWFWLGQAAKDLGGGVVAGRAAVPDLPADRLDARRRGALVRRARPARHAHAARRRARGRGRPAAAADLDAGRHGRHRRRCSSSTPRCPSRRCGRASCSRSSPRRSSASASAACARSRRGSSRRRRLVGRARAREHLRLVRVGRRPGVRRASSSARSG